MTCRFPELVIHVDESAEMSKTWPVRPLSTCMMLSQSDTTSCTYQQIPRQMFRHCAHNLCLLTFEPSSCQTALNFLGRRRTRVSTETTLPQQAKDAKAKRPDVSLEHPHTGFVANEDVEILANKQKVWRVAQRCAAFSEPRSIQHCLPGVWPEEMYILGILG